jgi:hypothetical protein
MNTNNTESSVSTAIKAERGPQNPQLNLPASSLRERVQIDDGRRQLVFAPLAWLKLRFLLHAGETEVGAFGITSENDLLYVEQLAVPMQRTSEVTVQFEDSAVADHFDGCFDRGIAPARCGRIWIHSHPGSSPLPSSTDELTFARAFGDCDWAVMAIIARGGASYARLRFAAGPGGSVMLPVVVDWQRLPQDLLDGEGMLDELVSQWLNEYGTAVHPIPAFPFETRSAISHAQVVADAQDIGAQFDSDFYGYSGGFDRLDELYDQHFLEAELWEDEMAGCLEQQEVMP